MLRDRIEPKWIDTFESVFQLCKIGKGDAVAILSESQSREINVTLTELALARMGARPFHVVVPTPRQTAPVPVRSTGASDAIQNLGPVINALASSTAVMLSLPCRPRRTTSVPGVGAEERCETSTII